MSFMNFRILCLSLAFLTFVPHGWAEVTVYPHTEGVESSPDYQVRVGGKEAQVQLTPVCSFTSFEFTGAAEVVIDVKRPILNAVIRPLSLNVQPSIKGNLLQFTIGRPCQLAIEVDDDLRRPLFIFANAPTPDAPKSRAPGIHFFEAGKIHEVGRINLKDNETVYIEGGAVVRGTIRSDRAKGIRIMGPGILDGTLRDKQTESILLSRCREVDIDGPIVLGSYGWSIVPRMCEDVRVRNVKVVGWRDNDDGFDPDSSRRVRVENCFFRTKDDCIAIKAHGREFATKGAADEPENLNTDDVRIVGSTFWSSEWGHALTVGFAVSAPTIRNVVFQDCDIIKKEKGWAMSIDNHDLGTVEQVLFEKIRVEAGCDKLIALKIAFSEYSADCPAEYFRNSPIRKAAKGEEWESILAQKRSSVRGAIKEITFRDIQISGSRLPPSSIKGFSSQSQVGRVLFEGIHFEGKALKSISEANIEVNHAPLILFGD